MAVGSMRVRDVMTYGAIGAPETATLAEAIDTLLRSRVSALPSSTRTMRWPGS